MMGRISETDAQVTLNTMLPYIVCCVLGFVVGVGAMVPVCLRVVALYAQEKRTREHYADLLRQHDALDEAQRILDNIGR